MKPIRILLLFLLIAVMLVLSVLLHRACNYFQNPQVQAFSIIPDNVSFIVKGKQTDDLLQFHQGNARFLSLLSSQKQQKNIDYLFNNILHQEKYRKITKNTSLYLSLHNETDEQWAIILETEKNQNAVLQDFIDFLSNEFNRQSFVYKNSTIYTFTMGCETLYINHHNGLLLMTYSENLMRQSINKSLQNSDAIQTAIQTLPAQRNDNAKILVFVQYQHFIPYLKNKIRKMGGNATELELFQACQWSVFDLSVKKENILLSGYTRIDTSNNQSKLLTHRNNDLDILKMLPYSANAVFSIKARQSADWKTIKSVVQTSEDFFALMYPTQILTFDIENDTDVFHYLLIKSEDISEASFHLYNSLRSSFENNHYLLDTFYIGSLLVGSVDLPNFVFTKLGMCNQLPRLKYYTPIDNYLIFTDKKESILTCIDQLKHNKSLYESVEYQSTQHYFTREANVFYYCNVKNNKELNKNFQCFRMQLYAQTDSVLVMEVLVR